MLNRCFRHLCVTAIEFYRRRLTGRGPFRKCRCTFRSTESCSAYGLRVLSEGTSPIRALARILRRLRRCRSHSVFLLESGALAWGPAYDAIADRPREKILRLRRELEAADELESTVRAVLDAAARIAIVSHGSRMESPPSHLRVTLRSEPAYRNALRRRMKTQLGLAAALAFLVPFLSTPAAWVVGGSVAVLAYGVFRAGRWIRRLEDQRIVSQLEAAGQYTVPPIVSRGL